MSYCIHCGELWYDCICIPWCYHHDKYGVCPVCKQLEEEKIQNKQALKPFLVKWYKNIFNFLLGR